MSEESSDDSATKEVLLGVVDAVYCLGVALSNAGVVTREELADIYGRTLAQMKRKAAAGELGSFPDARSYAVWALAEQFAVPVRTGLVAIEGGKDA